MGSERRGLLVLLKSSGATQSGTTQVTKAKPFSAPKAQVRETWGRVKSNQGGAGVGGMTIADFESNLDTSP